jgi:hypothetical protein
MPPLTPARFKQSRLPFAAVPSSAQPRPARAASGKDTADGMNTLADGGFSDGSATPAKSSKVAVVIYTPNKTHIVQDGLSHLTTPDQDTHAQSQTTSAPRWHQTKNQRDSTPAQQPRPKRGGVRRAPPQNCNSTQEPSRCPTTDPSGSLGDGLNPIGISSEHGNPEKLSLHGLTSPDSSVMDESAEEYEEPESPSRNRRSVNPRSFLAGGAHGNPPLPSSRPPTPKRSRLSGHRAAQGHSERLLDKTRASALVASPILRSTRSRKKLDGSIATQVDEEGAPVAHKESQVSVGLPAPRERIRVASTIKSGKRPMEQEVDEDEDVVIVRSKRRRAQLGGSSSNPDRRRDDRGEGEEEEQEDRDEEGGKLLKLPSIYRFYSYKLLY